MQGQDRDGQVAPQVRSPESAHTPGPWHFEESRAHAHSSVTIAIIDATDAVIAEVLFAHEPSPEDFANAGLFAAAPDMLAALQDCLPLFDLVACGEVQDRVKAAITKATMIAPQPAQSPLSPETETIKAEART